MIEFPAIKMEKKVKSMQMFHKPVNRVIQGDRVGVSILKNIYIYKKIKKQPRSSWTK
jgi:hypothetical protein